MSLEVLRVLYFFLPAYVANVCPVLVRGIVPSLAAPLDAGRSWRGKRIFGDHKTWRGLVFGVLGGLVVYELQRRLFAADLLRAFALVDYDRLGPLPGLLLGLGALVGDAVKSFFKRRVDIAPGASWLGFDQLDFFVGAYLFVAPVVVPPLLPTLACLPIVLAGDLTVAAIGYSLGLKEAWI
jgi:CDP-2,3-bis-(O-geranylgeranyl)-sn-glycerol synthase